MSIINLETASATIFKAFRWDARSKPLTLFPQGITSFLYSSAVEADLTPTAQKAGSCEPLYFLTFSLRQSSPLCSGNDRLLCSLAGSRLPGSLNQGEQTKAEARQSLPACKVHLRSQPAANQNLPSSSPERDMLGNPLQ